VLGREVEVGASCDPVEHACRVFEGSPDELASGAYGLTTGITRLEMPPLCVLPVHEGREHNRADDQKRHESEVATASSCAATLHVDVDLVPVRSTGGRQ
jgi:hypothetical protein